MPGAGDRNAAQLPPGDSNAASATRKDRRGLPDETAVVRATTFTSPKGKRYRILRTSETDSYDDHDGSRRK